MKTAEEAARQCEFEFRRERPREKTKNPDGKRQYKSAFYIVDKRTGKAVAGPYSVGEADMVLKESAGYAHRTHQVIGGQYLTEHAFKSNPKKKAAPKKAKKKNNPHKKKTSSKKRTTKKKNNPHKKKTSSKKRTTKKTAKPTLGSKLKGWASKARAEIRGARVFRKSAATNVMKLPLPGYPGETETVGKLNGEWHYWYDRQWFPLKPRRLAVRGKKLVRAA